MKNLYLAQADPLELCLNKIIFEQDLTAVFQPIVDNRAREIFGFEALIRGPSDSPLYSPIDLFKTAARYDRLVELERLCRTIAIKKFKFLDLPGKLFLNASPEVLTQPDFKTGCTLSSLHDVGLSANRVVIEITEQYALEDYDLLRKVLLHYKKMGFEVAIDDLGAGYAGLRMWSELRPNYVKVDRHFMQDIHKDKVKQEFVRSIKNIANELNCRVIGEGIETLEEYHTVRKIGLELSQGYYFSHPKELPDTNLPRIIFDQIPKNLKCKSGVGYLSKSIGDLLQPVEGISANRTVEETVKIFNETPSLESIPVVLGSSPIGLIRRNTVNNIMISEYGRYLYGKKTIQPFIDTNALVLESYLPIEEASFLVSEHINKDKELDFIITDDGVYRGIASVIDLLKVITDVQISSARHANPLTMLPGNVPIYEELDYLLREQQNFTVCYFDLDNFKPYNDSYGYEKGDQVIKSLADILRKGVDNKLDFVGHIGGDDFIVIFLSKDWQARCESMLQDFEQRLKYFYNPEDFKQSGIWSKDRTGKGQFFPLLSVSIGCINPDPSICKSHHAIARLATDAKHMAKKQLGNSLFIDQRRHV